MEDLLPNLNGGNSGESGAKISPWAKNLEFDQEKRITITRVARLCGTDTTAKPEFRDAEGCTYRMEFLDLNHGGLQRKLENKFKTFIDDVSRCGVKKGGTYKVIRTHDGRIYKWQFTEVGMDD